MGQDQETRCYLMIRHIFLSVYVYKIGNQNDYASRYVVLDIFYTTLLTVSLLT